MLKPLMARLGPAWNSRPALPAGLAKGMAPVLALAVAGTALALMLMWRDQASYKPVFGQRERVATAEMLAVLDAEQIAYRLHPDTGQVLVPDSALGRVRMLLAAKGVVAKLPAGLELMDRNDPLGVSQFVQDVRFRRGLEGELAQSMLTLDGVDSARVHLSIVKSSSFVLSDGQKSSASVVLALKPGRTLSNEQIAAVINMVSGSVASLDPARVSLVDQAGNLLSARVDLSEGFEANQGNEAAKRYQDEVRRNVRDLLAPVLGEDNYRLSVTAEVDNDRIQETREQYGDAPKLTNEAMREEQDRERIALGIPGSLSNRPVNAADPSASAPEANTGSARKNAATRQYAYDRNITQIKRSRGRLARLNVAVLLNNAAAPGPAGANGAGKTWTPDEIAKVEKLLVSGLGVNTERGDKLTVSPMSFPTPALPEPWYQQRDTILDFSGWLAYALAALLGYLLLARPLLRLAQARLAPATAAAGGTTALTPLEPAALAGGETTERGALPAPAADAANEPMSVVPLLENYELPPPGSPVDVLVDHLKVLAAKEPERVAEVVKQWVQKKNVRND
ncbi:flagellar basal-body MS-ring/collar protein FliF [Paucibacter sp. M5-1]|uniref:flagellar basal-body MS-ring/collar protein FliF n=1 Tax=Paucibacter sp. M5-1 TaxID=3015998 RepID=UPI0010F8F226|nr:flagellar basal-body MS-ring/collar protein FliF [Paucibacter sp. M5-1]MCZ7884655.1 flagellar basal-body MS-ring/collar protein FliF [Paucibacter sp. M5-1]